MLNNLSLIGRFTATPELKHVSEGISLTKFTLAVQRSFVSRSSDRQTDFIDVVAWRRVADFVCKYFQKGDPVAVVGSIRTDFYERNDGIKCKIFEVVANSIEFVNFKLGSNKGADNLQSSYSTNVEFSGSDLVTSDDDLPF